MSLTLLNLEKEKNKTISKRFLYHHSLLAPRHKNTQPDNK